jgi:hypothetical protein
VGVPGQQLISRRARGGGRSRGRKEKGFDPVVASVEALRRATSRRLAQFAPPGRRRENHRAMEDAPPLTGWGKTRRRTAEIRVARLCVRL